MLIVIFVLTMTALSLASVVPVLGQEPAAGPGSFDPRSSRPLRGVLTDGRTREAIRRAAATRESTGSAIEQPPTDPRTGWRGFSPQASSGSNGIGTLVRPRWSTATVVRKRR